MASLRTPADVAGTRSRDVGRPTRSASGAAELAEIVGALKRPSRNALVLGPVAGQGEPMADGDVVIGWREPVSDSEVVELTESHGGRSKPGWWSRVRPHSLGWVTARDPSGLLVGFVNVAWDGSEHAFLIDTKTRPIRRRRGVGTAVVQRAVDEARTAGCEWIFVDFGPELAPFISTPAASPRPLPARSGSEPICAPTQQEKSPEHSEDRRALERVG